MVTVMAWYGMHLYFFFSTLMSSISVNHNNQSCKILSMLRHFDVFLLKHAFLSSNSNHNLKKNNILFQSCVLFLLISLCYGSRCLPTELKSGTETVFFQLVIAHRVRQNVIVISCAKYECKSATWIIWPIYILHSVWTVTFWCTADLRLGSLHTFDWWSTFWLQRSGFVGDWVCVSRRGQRCKVCDVTWRLLKIK